MGWYNEYRASVFSCVSCSAREECRAPVPGEGDVGSKFVVIGRNPGKTEDEVGSPFVGAAGDILEDFLKLCGVSRREGCFVTNLALCHTTKDRFLLRHEVKACVKKFLIPTLLNLKPKVVLVLGNQPNYFVNGVEKISTHHGRIYRHKMGFYSVCSLHPAVVCYNRGLWVRFKPLAETVRRLLDANTPSA